MWLILHHCHCKYVLIVMEAHGLPNRSLLPKATYMHLEARIRARTLTHCIFYIRILIPKQFSAKITGVS